MTTPDTAEAPEADRNGTELPTEPARYLVTTPNTVRDAMEIYKLVLALRRAADAADEAKREFHRAQQLMRDTEEARIDAEFALKRAVSERP